MLSTHTELRQKLTELETPLDTYDQTIQTLIDAIHQLMQPPEPKKKYPIGFAPWPENVA